MSKKDVLLLVLVVPLVPGVLAVFLVAHWMGYLCGLVYGIMSECWQEFADQFRLGRFHMTGEGEAPECDRPVISDTTTRTP